MTHARAEVARNSSNVMEEGPEHLNEWLGNLASPAL
jgi:hypothetical protein